MAYENLKNSIKQVIKQNGNQEITGSILQSALVNIINTIGKGATFAGIATPTTNPGIPDGPVFYIASEPGNYVNFSNLNTIGADNKIHIIYNDINSNNWLEEALDLVEFAPVLKVLSLIGITAVSIGTNIADNEKARLSLAIGSGNTIGNICCLANGNNNKATGLNSHAEGDSCEASGNSSHAEGYLSITSGNSSHAEGDNCKSTAYASHTEGRSCTASGASSHAEGGNCTASGANSHAEGNNCKALGENSHAEGYSSKASGNNAHVEGFSCESNGDGSHAGGSKTIIDSTGIVSFAHGSGIHVKSANTFCVGAYNFYEFAEGIEPRFMIGIGTSDETRLNALVILANGNMFIKGIGGYEGKNILDNMRPLQNIIHI
nr:MAG TPA: YadA-like protein [Caudoviricetes sp.]